MHYILHKTPDIVGPASERSRIRLPDVRLPHDLWHVVYSLHLFFAALAVQFGGDQKTAVLCRWKGKRVTKPIRQVMRPTTHRVVYGSPIGHLLPAN